MAISLIKCTIHSSSQVCDHVKGLLLQCATPEAVCRLSDSKLKPEAEMLKQEAEMLCKKYMEEQQHSSLADYLRQQIRRETVGPGGDEGPQREIVYQVSLDVFLGFFNHFEFY